MKQIGAGSIDIGLDRIRRVPPIVIISHRVGPNVGDPDPVRTGGCYTGFIGCGPHHTNRPVITGRVRSDDLKLVPVRGLDRRGIGVVILDLRVRRSQSRL